MKKVLILFVCVFVSAISIQAQTHFLTGNHLVEDMRGYDKVERDEPYTGLITISQHGIFFGYVIGVCDAMQVIIPEHATQGQVTAIVAKYLKEHPELWDRPAPWLVEQAIIEAFDIKR